MDPTSDQWFDALIEESLPALLRTAVLLCDRRQADAEDLVHDAVLRALRARGQLRVPEAGRAWLFRILTTTHLNRLRTIIRRAETFATDLDAAAFEHALAEWTPMRDSETRCLAAADHTAVADAVATLPPNHRAVLLLSDVEGFSQREVSAILGVAEGTVASRLFRARRALRDRLVGDRMTDRPQAAI